MRVGLDERTGNSASHEVRGGGVISRYRRQPARGNLKTDDSFANDILNVKVVMHSENFWFLNGL